MRSTLDLESLKALVAGVSLGKFSKAAELVDRSPSTISTQMRKLEDQLGVPILRKVGRGLMLTPEGEILLDYAHKLLDLNDQAISAVRGAHSRFLAEAEPKPARRKRAQPVVRVVEVGDWPETLPVTKRLLDVFETHLADVLDELLGPLPGRDDIPAIAPSVGRRSPALSPGANAKNTTNHKRKRPRREP